MSSKLLIVDTSYLIFYRFHAIRTWISIAKPEIDIDIDDITQCEEFMKTYKNTFFKGIEKIIKSEKIDINNIIFARDCSSDKVWRKLLFPEYKANRDYTNFNGKAIFKWTYDNLLPIYANRGAKVVRFEYIEADDIAALIVMGNLGRSIIIVTNDNDYLQLLKYPDVKLINLKEYDLSKRSIGTPNGDLMKKIILGDQSDNIPKVFNRCGIKTLNQYLEDDNLLQEALKTDPEARKKYKLNRILIDFEQIPEIYKIEVDEWIDNNLLKI